MSTFPAPPDISHRRELIAEAAVFTLCVYEAVAIWTQVPTLSHGLWSLPVLARVVAVAIVGALLIDHLFTRRYV